jgi:hypothetical protein
MLEDAVIAWLLEPDNPPVRLLTLTRLLGRPAGDPAVQAVRAGLMDYAVTQGILAHAGEIWPSGPRSYWSFRGENWNTVYLGHFMADGRDPRIAQGVAPMLERRWVSDRFHCMTACVLAAFRRLGYGAHPTVVEGTEALAQRLLAEGGLACPGINTSLMPRCYMALPKVLLCLAEVPEDQRSPAIRQAIAWIADEIVAHRVYFHVAGNTKAWDAARPRSRRQADYPPGETPDGARDKARAAFLAQHGVGGLMPDALWTRFGFPLNYNSDVLEAMLALATAGAPRSEALEPALQIIRGRRTVEGTWRMDKSLNGQMWADVEIKGAPSKWITLMARMVLAHFGAE